MMQTPDSSDTCQATFIDHHIHGLAGVDFATASHDQLIELIQLLASRSTNRVVASLPSLRLKMLRAALERLALLFDDGLIAGVHLEGPFLAVSQCGAHPADVLLSYDSTSGRQYMTHVLGFQAERPLIKMMTLAPEVSGSLELIDRLVAHGIEPALGHTNATYAEMGNGIAYTQQAAKKPVVITHAYNAMRGFHHRDPGPMLAVLEAVERGDVLVELIADGFHVDLSVVGWWLKHFPESIRLVSDASAATLLSARPRLAGAPLTLGHAAVTSTASGLPVLDGAQTIASGAKDLLGIHDDLVSAGFAHDVVCSALRTPL